MAELRGHVSQEWGDDRAAPILDASTFPKSGADSCGVGRQWCGRPGKREDGQRGVFLGLRRRRRVCTAGPGALPAEGPGRGPRPSREMPRARGGRVPRGVAGRRRPDRTEQAGAAPRLGGRRRRVRPTRPVPLPASPPGRALHPRRPQRYGGPRPGMRPPRAPGRPGRPAAGGVLPGRRPGGPAAGGPPDPAEDPRRRKGAAVGRRDGVEGADRVGPAARAGGAAGGGGGRRGQARGPLRPEPCRARGGLEGSVRARSTGHRIEEVFGAGKGEVGPGQYEVRGWVGWHRRMTLSLSASWSLCCVREAADRGGNPGGERVAGRGDLHAAAPGPGPEPGADRRGDHPGAAPQGGGEDLPLARGDRDLPAAAFVTRGELIACSIV